ncbi:MAG: hydantoinase/oxoprolinase family protein [Solirubrobacteraceae bacterium]|nr:hydantoinase/oxoprolinase family protein [Solirubrobacteraceae bacterium]
MSARHEPRVLAIDAGGTMTDTFIVDRQGDFVVGKAQTTPSEEAVGFMSSACDALAYWDLTPEQAFPGIVAGVFSGTAMLNRLLERKGRRVGCIVSGGLEDYFRFERGVQTWLGMSYADRLHVITHHHNEPLVPMSRMRSVRGRIDVFGDEAIPLYDDEARVAVGELLDQDVEGIVVCLLHSYRNPAHEERVRDIALEVKAERGLNGEVPIFLSSELYPMRRDFPRLNSTLIEAYAAEPSRGQLAKVAGRCADAGAGFELRVMASHGGTISIDAKELARTLVSGPIGGVVGARHLARERGTPNLVCSDIGGTSFDLALVTDGEVTINQTPEIGRFLLNLPMVDIESIGAGTGSLVRIDPNSNRPEIGPESAGSRIGVSWPEGGVDTVTVTDVNLVLGRLNPSYFLGGQVELDVERARHEVERQIARPLGLSVEDAAGGILELFEEQLRLAALAKVLGRGYAPVDYALLCYGGGGPLHVAGYTEGIPYSDVLVPTWAAGFSAYGCACADHEYRYDLTTDIAIASDTALDDAERAARELETAWATLRERVAAEFAKSGIAPDLVDYRHLVRMQYAGQLNDIEVVASGSGVKLVASVVSGFEEAYGKVYARSARSPELGYVVTSAIVIGSVPVEKPALPFEDEATGAPEPKEHRSAWWSARHGFVTTPVFEQDDLRAGHRIEGPAVVEAPSTTFVVPPGRTAYLDRNRIFHLSAG